MRKEKHHERTARQGMEELSCCKKEEEMRINCDVGKAKFWESEYMEEILILGGRGGGAKCYGIGLSECI